MRRRTGRALVSAALGVAVLAGCSRSSSVSKDDVEDKVKEGVTAEVGAEPESVECDGDLPAEVGASIRCVLTAPNGDRIGVTVTTTDVADDDVRFELVVDDEVMG
jgi:hypothetical protein